LGRAKGARQFLKLLYSPDDRLRFQAALDLGGYAEEQWNSNPDGVRELLRRLSWSLNEESGATGWGAPEAIGEISARIPEMEKLYGSVFPGYLSHEEVFLDNAVLDTGALWAIGRLGPGSSADVPALDLDLPRFLASESASVRGAAVFAVDRLGRSTLQGAVSGLVSDEAQLVLPIDGAVRELTVAELARAAMTTFDSVA
jgi:hypothetical protein